MFVGRVGSVVGRSENSHQEITSLPSLAAHDEKGDVLTGLLYEAISLRQMEKLHQNLYGQSHSEKVIFAILVTVFSELFIGPRNPTAATQSQPRTQTTFSVTNRIGCSHRPPRLKTPHARARQTLSVSPHPHTLGVHQPPTSNPRVSSQSNQRVTVERWLR